MTTIDDKDRTRISNFLVSNAGRTLLAWLREPEQKPKIRTNNVQPHDIQMDAGAQLGYDRALETIETFTIVPAFDSDEPESPTLRMIRTTKPTH